MAAPEPSAPRRRSPVLWVCLLVLVEVLAYGALSVITADPTVRVVGALLVGVAVFVPLRHQVWGGDLATVRARQRNGGDAPDRRRPAGDPADPRADRPRRRRRR